MANLAHRTRRDQVLDYLRAHKGDWVDGPDLANEAVGGSEGLKRLRELRAEGGAAAGYVIESRMHPDKLRDIWQYRLLDAGSTAVAPIAAFPPAPSTAATRDPFGRIRLVCQICTTPNAVAEADLDRTLSPHHVEAYCSTCRRRTLQTIGE